MDNQVPRPAGSFAKSVIVFSNNSLSIPPKGAEDEAIDPRTVVNIVNSNRLSERIDQKREQKGANRSI